MTGRIPAHALTHAWTRAFDAPVDPGHRCKVPGQHDGGALHGVPLGGLGTGGINRDWRGQFRRWTLKTGAIMHFTEAANAFAVATIGPDGPLSAEMLQPREAGDGALEAWAWPDGAPPGGYRALFPKAWYDYPATPARPIDLTCEQLSPVIPGDMTASTLPLGLFRWRVHNRSDGPLTVALMGSFANLVNQFTAPGRTRPQRRAGGLINRPWDGELDDGRTVSGVEFAMADMPAPLDEGQGTMALCVAGGPGVTVSRHICFDARGDGAEVWAPFAATGALQGDETGWIPGPGFTEDADALLGGAVAARIDLAPGEVGTVDMALAWDLPVIRFGTGARYHRRHTDIWGRGGARAGDIASHGLAAIDRLGRAIDTWHGAEMACPDPPEAVQQRLNELYLLVEGLTVWTGVEDSGPARDFFGVIECPDYPYYNTFDLWVYASFALAHLWPELEESVIRAYARAVLADDPRPRRDGAGRAFPVTPPGAVPHDLGAPDEHPVALVNAYTYRDPSDWKDLPAQFALTVWRDVTGFGGADLARACWPAVEAAMDRLMRADRDGDGLPDHADFPDQTFDNIRFSGPSAYCGGLTVAALSATARLAALLDDATARDRFAVLERRARAALDGLWTGTHFRLDRDSANGEAVLTDQLFGPWLARITGLGDVVEAGRARTALTTIFQRNAVWRDGVLVGLATLTGLADAKGAHALDKDPSAQTAEMLIGINHSLANQAEAWGLPDMARAVRAAVWRQIYDERGLWFRTPAAVDLTGHSFRAIMNMRPLAAWGAVWRDDRSQPSPPLSDG